MRESKELKYAHLMAAVCDCLLFPPRPLGTIVTFQSLLNKPKDWKRDFREAALTRVQTVAWADANNHQREHFDRTFGGLLNAKA